MEHKLEILPEKLEVKSNNNQISHKSMNKFKGRRIFGICIVIIIAFSALAFLLYFFLEADIHLNNDLSFLNHYSIKSIDSQDLYSLKQFLILDKRPKFINNEINPSHTNLEIDKLIAEFISIDDNSLEIKIYENNKSRWEVPFEFGSDFFLYDEQKATSLKKKIINQTNLKISNVSEKFSFSLKDDYNNDVLTFNRTYFRYLDKYIVFEVELPSQILL